MYISYWIPNTWTKFRQWRNLNTDCKHVCMRAQIVNMCACVLSHFSGGGLHETLWTVAHQAPLFMGFFRQAYWSGLPCPPPGDLPDPGIEPASLMSPALAATWEAHRLYKDH